MLTPSAGVVPLLVVPLDSPLRGVGAMRLIKLLLGQVLSPAQASCNVVHDIADKSVLTKPKHYTLCKLLEMQSALYAIFVISSTQRLPTLVMTVFLD